MDTYSEQHRLDCEARYVLAKPREERGPWLDAIEAKRGKEAADYLRDAVRRVHQAERSSVDANTSDDRSAVDG